MTFIYHLTQTKAKILHRNFDLISLLTGRDSGRPFLPLSNCIQINNVIMIKFHSTGKSKIFNTKTNINNIQYIEIFLVNAN